MAIPGNQVVSNIFDTASSLVVRTVAMTGVHSADQGPEVVNMAGELARLAGATAISSI